MSCDSSPINMRASGGSSFVLRLLGLYLAQCLLLVCAAESNFEQANRLYEQGKYSEAASIYESIIRAGRNSPGVFFNLGNAYFKSGEPGRAIYYYRRAAELAPRDEDVRANLRFARDKVSGSASVQPKAWQQAVDYFTLDEIAVGAAVFFWLWLGLLSILRWRPELRRTLRPWCSGTALLLSVAVLLLVLRSFSASERTAIIVAKQGIVHLGPLAESQAAFNVPEGTELKVEARRDNWVQVTDRSNRTGWIESAQLLEAGSPI